MIIKSERVTYANEELLLTNQRAVFWEKQNMLILSDLHIGKTAHFRKSGIPIPSKVLENDLQRLEKLIDHFQVEHIAVVGDMFHAEVNEDIAIFSKWNKTIKPLEWILIKGNHDKWNCTVYQELSIRTITPSLEIGPFTLIHNIRKLKEEKFYIAGHTHPGISIKGLGKQRIKLPCYQISDRQLRLPAFSLFTGLNTRKPSEMCVHYAFTEESIFQI